MPPATSSQGDVIEDDADGDGRTTKQMRNARKKANAKAKAKADKVGVEEGPEHIKETPNTGSTRRLTLLSGKHSLRVPDFVILARYLTSQAVEIPVELIRLLKRCIRLRLRACREMAGVKEAREGGHQHFVGILSEVLAVLSESSDEDDNEKTADQLSDMAMGYASPNSFAPLETDAGDEDMADIRLPPPPNASATPSSVTFSVRIDQDEAALRMLAFFVDVHSVRRHLAEVWTDYKDGKVDLVTASIVTNTALELLRKPHAHLVARVMPVLARSVEATLAILYNWLKGFTGAIEIPPVFTELQDRDPRCFLYEYLLLPNLQMLGGLADIIRPGFVPSYKPGHYGAYKAYARGTFQERWRQNTILMGESLSEYIILAAAGESMAGGSDEPVHSRFAYDEIVLHMDELSHTRTVTLMTLVCSQVFFDINDILREEVGRGIKEMRAALRQMIKSLYGYEAMLGEFRAFRPPGWIAENDTLIKGIREHAEAWISNDPINIARDSQYPGTKSHLLERSPLLCGQILFAIMLDYQHAGLQLVNGWYSIMAASHLYVAAQSQATRTQTSRLHQWPDMQAVIDLHGMEDMFCGETPKSIDAALESYMRMCGFSNDAIHLMGQVGTGGPITESRIRRAQADPGNPAYTRGLVDHAHLVPIFRNKYATLGAQKSVDISHVEALLKDMSSKGISGNDYRRKRKHKSPKFSIIQLLSVLERGLVSETASLRFDYISMHIRCLRLIRSARDRVDTYIAGKHPESWPVTRNNLAMVVYQILQIAMFSNRAAQVVGFRRGDQVGSKVMQHSFDALREVLTEKERDVEVKKMNAGRQVSKA